MDKTINRPNIVFVMADDMGYGDAGCYGAQKISTPNIDLLAKGGIRFTDTHSSSAVCTPSRYSVLTGRYSWRTRLKSNVQCGHGLPLIEKGRETVASALQKVGYSTGAFGKWHLGFKYKRKDGTFFTEEQSLNGCNDKADYHYNEVDYSAPLFGGPLDHGFDEYFGISGSLDMPPYCFIKNRHTVGIPSKDKICVTQQSAGLAVENWDDHIVDVRFTEETCDFIERNVEINKPFFAYVPLSSPHRPNTAPKFMQGKSQAGPRGDCVMLADWCLGQIIDKLKEKNIFKNTLIIFTSDNGANACDYFGRTYGHKSNADLRGYKADIYEGGHRIPFIASWPGVITPGSVSDSLSGLVDFAATIADITNIELENDAFPDSVSLKPIFSNPMKQVRDIIINHSVNGMFAVRTNEWKLIDGLGSGGFSSPVTYEPERLGENGQLYSMKDDYWEQVNSYLKEKAVVNELMTRLDDIKKS